MNFTPDPAKLAKLKPDAADAGAAGLGAAIGVILVSLLAATGIWDVPAEPAVAFGTLFTWLSVRYFG